MDSNQLSASSQKVNFFFWFVLRHWEKVLCHGGGGDITSSCPDTQTLFEWGGDTFLTMTQIKKNEKKKKTKHVLEHTVTFRENYCCYSLFIISVHFLTAVFLGSLQYLIVCSAAFLTRRIIIRQLFLFFFFKWKLLEIWHLISVDCRPAVCVWKRLKHLDSSIDTRERKSPSTPPTNVFCFFCLFIK
jgi:hypothetical protein